MQQQHIATTGAIVMQTVEFQQGLTGAYVAAIASS